MLTGKARDGFDQREVGLARAMLVEALAVRDPDRLLGVQLLQKAIGQRALADTRLPGQEDELALPRAGALKTSRELCQLGVRPTSRAGSCAIASAETSQLDRRARWPVP